MMAQLPGPLVVSKANPRYFAAPAAAGGPEKLIYLTGSHVNNNLHDGLGPGRECPDDRSGSTSTPTSGSSRSVVIISFAWGCRSCRGASASHFEVAGRLARQDHFPSPQKAMIMLWCRTGIRSL